MSGPRARTPRSRTAPAVAAPGLRRRACRPAERYVARLATDGVDPRPDRPARGAAGCGSGTCSTARRSPRRCPTAPASSTSAAAPGCPGIPLGAGPSRPDADAGGADGPAGGVPGRGRRPSSTACRALAAGGSSAAGPRSGRSSPRSGRSTWSPPGPSRRSPGWSAGAAACCGPGTQLVALVGAERVAELPAVLGRARARPACGTSIRGLSVRTGGRCHYRGGHDAWTAVTDRRVECPSRCSTWNRYRHPTPFHVERHRHQVRCRKDPR